MNKVLRVSVLSATLCLCLAALAYEGQNIVVDYVRPITEGTFGFVADFQFDRDLLKDLCAITHECLLDNLRTPLGLEPEDLAQLRGLHPLRLHRGHHPTHREQVLLACQVLWMVLQQDARPARQGTSVEAQAAGPAVPIIDVSERKPHRIPPAKRRELIKKVWEADPLLCLKCQKEMRLVALIADREVIERILHHLGLWQQVCA